MSEVLSLHNIFWNIAIFSTALFIIKMILFSFIDTGAEVDADFTSITDTDISFNFLSLQTILAFLMGFGWIGFLLIDKYHYSSKIAFAAAIVVGLALMFFSAYLMFCIRKLDKKIVYDYTTLIGKEGKAYINIPAKKEGQIEIDFNSKLSMLDAINSDDELIESFSAVKVIKVENNKIYITKNIE